MNEETRETTRLPRTTAEDWKPRFPVDTSDLKLEGWTTTPTAKPRRAAPKGVQVSYWFLALLVLLALLPTVLLVYATAVGW